MATLTENITALREKLDQIITFMIERGVSIETGADLETIRQRMGSDPFLNAVMASAVLSGGEITDRYLSDLTEMRPYAFYKHTGIKDATFGACTSIGDHAFAECTAMTKITFGYSCTIGESAFEGCTALTAVGGERNTYLAGAKSIGANAFKNCTSLTGTLSLKRLDIIGANAFAGTNFSDLDVNVSVEGKVPSDFDNYPWGLPSGCVIDYGASGKKYTIE